MNLIILMICILVWVGCGFLTEYLGKSKGQKGCFLYGLLLGIIGVIIVLCLKDKSGEIETTTVNNTMNNKYEDLERLQKLKESGTITDEEFKKEKTKILE